MQKWAIGIDLGGTKIEVAIVSNEGKLLDRARIPTENPHTPEEIVDHITNAVDKLRWQHPDIKPSCIGVGMAGQIDKKTGAVIYAPNLGWHDVNLQQLLTDKLNIPAIVCNDVRAATWGEWLYGSGADCDNLLCIFVGTGIGGAIVSNGQMLEGFNNTAGEIGHTIIQMNGPKCHCGNEGCFEALAGGWAIERDAQQAVKDDKAAGDMILQLAGGDITKVTGKEVTEAAQKGDKLAMQLIDDLVAALTAGITSAINMIGPSKVVLGGGVMEGMPELVDRVAKELKTRSLKAAIEKAQLLPAELHNDSGVIGAAAYAMHTIENNKK